MHETKKADTRNDATHEWTDDEIAELVKTAVS